MNRPEEFFIDPLKPQTGNQMDEKVVNELLNSNQNNSGLLNNENVAKDIVKKEKKELFNEDGKQLFNESE